MASKVTNAQLLERIEALEAELKALKAQPQSSTTRSTPQPAASGDDRYPYLDHLGRKYRLEGRTRCFPASTN